jgi:hypothetical protein
LNIDYHHNNQPLVKVLHKALREKNFDTYKLYEESVTSRPPTTLRDVLQFNSSHSPVPLDSVEPVEAILKRFCTGTDIQTYRHTPLPPPLTPPLTTPHPRIPSSIIKNP